jgi:cytoskeletal protein RodZ
MSNPMEELRRAREAAGLSLEDVERKIHVQSRYLKAIEEGDFSALPGYSYTRAIIRSYAQCLGVSSAPILHYYEEQSQSYTTEVLTPARRPLPIRRDRYAARKSRSKDRKPPFWTRLSSKKLWIGSLSLIFLLIVTSTLYFFVSSGDEPAQEDGMASVEASQPSEEGASSGEDASPPAAPSKDEAAVTVRLVKTSESNEHGDEYAIDNAEKVVVTIKASAESWFRARGGGPTKAVMKDGYIQAGKTETFTHSNWISLHLGKPDKIELYVNGYLIDTEGQKDPQTYQFRLNQKDEGKTKKNS